MTGKPAEGLAILGRWFNTQNVSCLSRDLNQTLSMLLSSPKNTQVKCTLILTSHSSYFFTFQPCSLPQSRAAFPNTVPI